MTSSGTTSALIYQAVRYSDAYWTSSCIPQHCTLDCSQSDVCDPYMCPQDEEDEVDEMPEEDEELEDAEEAANRRMDMTSKY